MILETAKATLLAPFDLETGKLERVFGTLFGRRVDYADLYFQYSRFEGWSLEEGIVKSGSFNIEQGVGVRAVSGEKTALAYSDQISFAALEDAAKATRAIGSAGQVRRIKTSTALQQVKPLYSDVDPIGSLNSESKVALLENIGGLEGNQATEHGQRGDVVMFSEIGSFQVPEHSHDDR